MEFTYNIPVNVSAILAKVDYLGFEDESRAVQAIVSHTDWDDRWEVKTQTWYPTPDRTVGIEIPLLTDWEIETLKQFRRTIINNIRNQKFS